METICSFVAPGSCNTLHRADGTLIAAAAPTGDQPRLDLDFLRGPSYPNGEAASAGDYLDECGGFQDSDALAMRGREGFVDVAYGRARHDWAGALWLQYWFFYHYEDKALLGLERREGDWEMVQLRLGEGGVPDAATFAQHAGAERPGWDQVELASAGDGLAAVIYPARGSHPSRPRAGSHEAPVVPDHNDGLGPCLRPRLAAIGGDGPGWVLWPGRWGSTRRREHFEADSPRGPREHPQWWDPAELHEEARPWTGARSPAAAGDSLAPAPARTETRRGEPRGRLLSVRRSRQRGGRAGGGSSPPPSTTPEIPVAASRSRSRAARESSRSSVQPIAAGAECAPPSPLTAASPARRSPPASIRWERAG